MGSPSADAVPPAAGPAQRGAGWWRDRVFYEVFVRSFADSNGDGVGDLRGLIGRLDYLNDGDPATTADLGVTGLWLMPTFPSPSYHGYDATDFRSVNADYGSLADLRALVAAAHHRGIAILLDLPINHTSNLHPWFLDSRKQGSAHTDWYVWSDHQLAGNWHRDGSRLYYGAFGPDFPDLNLAEPEVTAAIDEVARFWIADVGVDGFRIDAAKHLIENGSETENTPQTKVWLHSFRASVERAATGALLIGETEAADPTSLWSWYRDLIALRTAHPALAAGSYMPVASDVPDVVAAIRATPTETALVIANTGVGAASPALTLASGPLCGSPAAKVVLGVGVTAGPLVTPTGGFRGYRPFVTIPSRSVAVIDLVP